jgi:hypothetical protein
MINGGVCLRLTNLRLALGFCALRRRAGVSKHNLRPGPRA